MITLAGGHSGSGLALRIELSMGIGQDGRFQVPTDSQGSEVSEICLIPTLH